MPEMTSLSETPIQRPVSPKSRMGAGDVRTQGPGGLRPRHPADLDALRAILKRIRSGSVTKSTKPAPKKRRSSIIEAGLRPDLLNITPTDKDALGPTVSEIKVEVPEKEEIKTQKALVVSRKGEYEIRPDFPIPALGDNEVMIRSHYVGLNPIDWKSVEYNFCLPEFPWVCLTHMIFMPATLSLSFVTYSNKAKQPTETDNQSRSLAERCPA